MIESAHTEVVLSIDALCDVHCQDGMFLDYVHQIYHIEIFRRDIRQQ